MGAISRGELDLVHRHVSAILLIRDYGTRGYWLFALPNVVGAAAMGWVIRSRASSLRIVTNHYEAAAAFSIVTISFHFYFAAWLVRTLWSPTAIPVLLGASISLVLLVQLLSWSDRVLSVVAFAVSFMLMSNIEDPIRGLAIAPLVAPSSLLGLGLVCALGFVFCPYLDLTFHRARQRIVSKEKSRWAFSLGFGLFFSCMILCTASYADPIRYLLKDGYLLGKENIVKNVSIHLLAQSSVTVAFHIREIFGTVGRQAEHQRRYGEGSLRRNLLTLIGCVIAATLIGLSIRGGLVISGLNRGELIYRCFLGFYGLIFPAYVWLCMIPGRGKLKPTQRQLVITAIAMLVALPMFWMGFIERQMGWLVPGVGVVLFARLFDRRSIEPCLVASATTGPTQQNSAPISN